MTISLMLPLVGKTQTDLKRVDKGTGSLSFTRATTATRLNPDTNLIESVASGDLREDGRQYYNRLLYSEDFSQAAWVKTNVAVTNDNVLGPNGKTGAAQTLTPSAANGTCLQAVVDISSARYGSLYLKRKTGVGNIQVTLDGGATWTTVAVTAAWTRLGAGQTLTNPSFGVRIVTSGDAVYAWGAQLEDGSAARRYVKSGSSPAHSPKGVLIEGQRTNLLTYSEQFNNAAWANIGGGSISANAVAAPDGNTTADGMVEEATTTFFGSRQLFSASSGTKYAFSCYVSAGSRSWAYLRENTTGDMVFFNLSTGVVGTASARFTGSKITLYGNGWWRIEAVWEADSTSARSFTVGAASSDNTPSYLGVAAVIGTYFWGAQIEEASFSSSYIPTTSAAVTRNADVLIFPTSGNLSSTLGTISLVVTPNGFPSLDEITLVGNPADYNSFCIHDTTVRLRYREGANGQYFTGVTMENGVTYRAAIAYSAGISGTLALDGDAQSGKTFNGGFAFEVSVQIGGSTHAYLFGYIKNLLIFNRALSDAEMIAITS